MGDRVAEYLNFTIMIVTMVAVIMLGGSLMFLGRKMQNMFYDKVAGTNAETNAGYMRDLMNKGYEEMTGASVLALIYESQDHIYDVYDYRDVTEKDYVTRENASGSEVIGSIRNTVHVNVNGSTRGRDTTKLTADTRERMRVATSWLANDLNMTVKVVLKKHPNNTDYYDLYLHDMDCRDVNHTTPYCKTCKVNGGKSHTGNCTKGFDYIGTYQD